MIWWVDLLIFLFLGQVESVISDPVHLLASMAAMCCIFHQLATWGVEILLGKLAVGGHTDQNKNRYSDTEHTFKCRITGCKLFCFGETRMWTCTHIVFLCFTTFKKITYSTFKAKCLVYNIDLVAVVCCYMHLCAKHCVVLRAAGTESCQP